MQFLMKKFKGLLNNSNSIKALTVLLVLVSLLIPLKVLAKDKNSYEYKNDETGYEAVIDDDAELLSRAERKKLLRDMEAITEFCNVGFKTTEHNNSSVEYYAEDYLHDSFGRGANATVLVIDMDNRKICVYSDGECYDIITSSYADTITDNIYKYASDGDYYAAAQEAYAEIYTLLDGGRIAQPMKYISNGLIAIILALIINYFIANSSSKAKKISNEELLKYTSKRFVNSPPSVVLTGTSKRYNPPSSSSGGGGHSGGGGGHSGGGGSHSF